MRWAEDYRAGKIDPASFVLASEIYDSICDELGIGVRTVRTDKNAKNENRHDRDSAKVRLRANCRFLINVIARSNYDDFKVNNKVVLIPKEEAPIIQMILAASISAREEDKLIAKWMQGHYELPRIEDYGFIAIMYSTLTGRIQQLFQAGKIDFTTQKHWIEFLRIRLNYDSVEACWRLLHMVSEVIDASRPLVSFIDDTTLNQSDSFIDDAAEKTSDSSDDSSTSPNPISYENAYYKTLQLKLLIEKELVPLLRTQQDYMYVIKQVLDSLVASAVKQSAKVLETAHQKSLSGDEMQILSDYKQRPEASILGKPFSWDILLQLSLTQNSSLKSGLSDNPELKDLIKEIADREYKEWNERYKMKEGGVVETRPKRAKKKS